MYLQEDAKYQGGKLVDVDSEGNLSKGVEVYGEQFKKINPFRW